MNQQQQKYTINKITEIANKQRSQAKDLCTTPAVKISDLEKVEKLLSGDFKIVEAPIKQNHYSIYWYDYIDFGQRSTIVDKEKQLRIVRVINEEEASLKDQVMLGEDHGKILKAIIEFSKKEYV